jgi:hypothetical protein
MRGSLADPRLAGGMFGFRWCGTSLHGRIAARSLHEARSNWRGDTWLSFLLIASSSIQAALTCVSSYTRWENARIHRLHVSVLPASHLETLVATTCRRSNAASSRFLNSCAGDILVVFPSAATLPVREWSEIPWS